MKHHAPAITDMRPEWGSDAVAEMLRALDIPYMTLNPGASFRGIHDSIINYLGNEMPKLLLCLHEEAAVSIAHGYAKITGRPLAAALHSNVGLLHGSMGIFNAWCDRVPMLVIGATGPLDAAKRRPWIDWIHTTQDQGALIRDFIKWDDQPGSVMAARWSLLEAVRHATTAPMGPVYVNVDAAVQEDAIEAPLLDIDVGRFAKPAPVAPNPEAIKTAAKLLLSARNPVILVGRVQRTEATWSARVRLAERLGAKVLTDFKTGSTFPTDHPLHAAPSGYFLTEEGYATLRKADVVIDLDWVDSGGTLRAAFNGDAINARIISATVDRSSHRGFGKEAGSPPPVDVLLANEPDIAVAALLEELGPGTVKQWRARRQPVADNGAGDTKLTAQNLASTLQAALSDRETTLIRAPLSWTGSDWPMRHPLAYLGYDGGGGIGSGTGMAVGGALALRDHHPDRLPIAVLGDGDFLMNASAVWTAANAGIPLLIVIANNRSFYNDEVHQEKVAIHRGRPVENKHIGLATDDPDIDIAKIAEGHGAVGLGAVLNIEELKKAVRRALDAVQSGKVAVIDARIAKGYSPAMANAMRG